jgi:hypothetical protein
VKGGDSSGMSEADESSQRTRRGGDGSTLTQEANRMLVTKALPHEVALLAFVPHLKRKSVVLLQNSVNLVFMPLFYILSYLLRKTSHRLNIGNWFI